MYPASDTESQLLGVFLPNHKASVSSRESSETKRAEFRQAFLMTVQRKGEGLLMPYLFHDQAPPPSTNTSGNPGTILYGSMAWDSHVQNSSNYKFVNNDLRAIDYALKGGLLDILPPQVQFIEYGTGGKTGVEKPKKLMEAYAHKRGNQIHSYVGVDISPRYAKESALEMHEEFNIMSYSVKGDFMTGNLNLPKAMLPTHQPSAIPAPIITIFGGAFANAPDLTVSGGKTAKQHAHDYFEMITKHHERDAFVVMSYDAQNNPVTLLEEYRMTPAFHAFFLSAFIRAVREGVITDPTYDPHEHWQIVPVFDSHTKAVKFCDEALDDHIMPTVDGDIQVRQGERFVQGLSYKWNENDYREILKGSGFNHIHFFKDAKHSTGIMVASTSSTSSSRWRPSP